MAKSKAPAAKTAAKDNGAAAKAAAPNGDTNGGDKPIRNLYLVDGSGYLFRAYHALPPMTRPDGVPINAVYGFCRMLVADLLDKPEVDHIAMILDAGEVTFRNEIYDKYKANRPPPPEDLIPQFPLIREAARAFNVTVCELEGYEADDLIATYARLAVEAGASCTIVSSDKDLMQLIRPGVEMMDPIKKTKLGPEAVMEKFGVTPDKVIDVQALAGDSTDNVPGVPGIGVKTAAQLINEYGDLETLLDRAGEIKQPKRREALQQNAELARISRKLVTLRDDVPTPAEPEAFDKKKPDPNVLLPWLEQQGFQSLLARFTGELGEATAPVAPAAPVARPALPAPETKAAPAARAKSNQPFTAADYELITDETALDEWIAEATRAGTVAFDCETDALDAQNGGLVGVSLALLEGPWGNVNSTKRRAAYLPLSHRKPGAEAQGALDLSGDGGAKDAGDLLPGQIPLKTAIAKLKPLLEDPSVLKVGQNIKYDMCVFRQLGIEVAPVDDTMLLSFVLDAGQHNHGMDELAKLHLGQDTIKFSDVTGSGAKQVGFDKVPIDKARDYAAEDADVTLQLWAQFKPRLAREHMVGVYETIERPLIPVLLGMEQAGIKVDAPQLRRLSAEFEKRMLELEQELHKLAGRPFNVGSPKQLGEILFDEKKLPGGRRNKTGAWATDVSCSRTSPPRATRCRSRSWSMAAARQAQMHLYRCAGARARPRDRPRPHLLPDAGAATGPARLDRSQPAEHPGPHRGRPQDPPGLHRRAGPHAAVGRLFADRAAAARARRRHRRAQARPSRAATTSTRITASRDVRRAGRGHGPDDAPARQGDQLRHHLRHLGLRPRQPARHRPARGARRTSTPISQRYPGIRDYMETTKEDARKHGYVRTPFGRKIHLPGHRRQEPGACAPSPSARRSTRRCRAAPPTSSSARWSGCPGARRPPAQAPHAAAGARRAAVRGARGGGRQDQGRRARR